MNIEVNMNISMEKFRKLNQEFKNNLSEVPNKVLPKTKDLFEDFRNIFNLKTLAVIGLATIGATANAADVFPLSTIQSTFQESVKIQNVHYNPNLPTYFENKNNNVENVTYKNEFWENNIVTLVKTASVDESIYDKKYAAQIDTIDSVLNEPYYVNRVGLNDTQEYVNKMYSQHKDDYRHYFRNSIDKRNEFVHMFEDSSKKYLDDFITYHEMAHASYEQQISRIDKHYDLKIDNLLKAESHSDVSSIFMIAHKNNMSYSEFKDFALDLMKVRSAYATGAGDYIHNSSVVLAELVQTLDKNPNIYENMTPEKISAFSAYFVTNVFNQDSSNFIKNIKNFGMPVDIVGFLDKYEEVREQLVQIEKDGKNIFQTPINTKGVSYIVGMLEDVYFTRNPEFYKEYMEAANNQEGMVMMKLKEKMYDDIKAMADKDLQILAVESAKMIKTMTFETYSGYLSQIIKPDSIHKAHTTMALDKQFSENKKELNEILKSSNSQKNRI